MWEPKTFCSVWTAADLWGSTGVRDDIHTPICEGLMSWRDFSHSDLLHFREAGRIWYDGLRGPHNHCPFVIWGQLGHRPLLGDVTNSGSRFRKHVTHVNISAYFPTGLICCCVQNDSYVTTFDPLVHSVAGGNLVRSRFFFCSAQVSGSNNTTFISSGQVMNFSGEVIVVYVGHSSPGSDGTDQEGIFRNPVQEEANESALHFQTIPRAQQDSISHDALQDETLPIQEMMERWMLTGLLVACPLN